MATAQEVAAWMRAAFERDGELLQSVAVEEIRTSFGAAFVPWGRIRRDVLYAFRRLAPGGRIWDQRQRAWRRRNRHDPPDGGRRVSRPETRASPSSLRPCAAPNTPRGGASAP